MQKPVDAFGEHEVLDRAWMVQRMFEEYLLDHPHVRNTHILNEAAEKLNEQLVAFYCLVGSTSA